MYRVMLADADISICQRICRAFLSEQKFRIVANCADPERTARIAAVLRPDVLLINMAMVDAGKQNVVQALMAQAPTRVIAYAAGGGVTDLQMRDVVDRGALDAVYLRQGVESELLALATKWCKHPKPDKRGSGGIPKTVTPVAAKSPMSGKRPLPPRIVAIGASTGGPAALEVMVRAWPADFPTPIVVAQHLSNGFISELVQWLGTLRSVKVKVASHNEKLQAATLYFAPDGMHVTVTGDDSLHVHKAEPDDITVPSVNRLFQSVAEHYGGAAVGVILTGMGDDGAAGMHAMQAQGARTVAQNQDTCAVFGMPQAAIKQGGVGVVLPLGDIAHYVHDCATKRGRA